MLHGSRRWLIKGLSGVGVLLGSFFLTLAIIDARNLSIPEEARRGVEIQIKLDPKACAANLVGELSCDQPYHGRYTRANNSWTITGRPRNNDKIATRSDTNAPNELGAISIWGGLGKFDQDGKLTMGGAVVGVVQVTEKSLLQRIF